MKKTLMLLAAFSFTSNLMAQTLVDTQSDVFVTLKNKDNQICQGVVLGKNIVTSAKCVCSYPLDRPKKRIHSMQLINTVKQNVLDLKVHIFVDDLACKFNDPNIPYSRAANNLAYDPYFFDIAVLDIVEGADQLVAPKSSPRLSCARPDHNKFIMEGFLGILNQSAPQELAFGSNRFSLMNKPNYISPELELFSTGCLVASQKQFYTAGADQDGSSLISLTDSLLTSKQDKAFDHSKIQQAIAQSDYRIFNIPALTVRGKNRTKEVDGSCSIATPFFNVKKLLRKNIDKKFLNSDCLKGNNPTGFSGGPIEIF